MSAPPMTWPPAAATPMTMPYTLIARARSGPWKSTPISDSMLVMIIAAPTPWTSRAMISSSGVVATRAEQRGDREDADAEREQPPAPDPIAEATSGEQAARQGEPVAGDDPLELARVGVSPCWIEGMATLTMKKSSTTRKTPATRTGRARHGASPETGGVVSRSEVVVMLQLSRLPQGESQAARLAAGT